MKLLPREWDIIVRALQAEARRLDGLCMRVTDGYPESKRNLEDIKTLIERIELNRSWSRSESRG